MFPSSNTSQKLGKEKRNFQVKKASQALTSFESGSENEN